MLRTHSEVTGTSLHSMADAMPQIVWIARPDGSHEYYNRQWYEFTGTPREIKGEEAWDNALHPADLQRVRSAWLRAVKTTDPYKIQYRLYHAKTKSFKWVVARARPQVDDMNKVLLWYGTCNDIDEHKRALDIQTFLSDVSKELSTTLNFAVMLRKVAKLCVPVVADWCSIDLYDKKKGFDQVAVAHADTKKVSLAREYRKHNPIYIDNPAGVPAVIRTGKTEFYPNITPGMLKEFIDDKARLDFMLSLNLHSIIIAPISINKKVVGGISFVSSDSGRHYTETDLRMAEELAARISLAMTNAHLYAASVRASKERKVLEKALQQEKIEEQYVKYLVELNRSKDEFISIASHQLRTPATGVKQYLGMVLEGFAGEVELYQKELLTRAYASNERQLRIVTDLLKVAQVDAGKIILHKSDVGINGLIEDIIREQQATFEQRHQMIRYQPLESEQSLYIDRDTIRMVFENIIDNASKYSEENKMVTVKVEEQEKMVCVLISDEGVGIKLKDRARLFEKFSRLDNTLSTKVGGTGLGLYWAKKIVDLHGGTIRHKPNNPTGTIFVISLPKQQTNKLNVRKVTTKPRTSV